MLALIGTGQVLDGRGPETRLRTVTIGESKDPVSPDTPIGPVSRSTFGDFAWPIVLPVLGGGQDTFTAVAEE